jgi:hypothetical protein
MPRPRPYSAYLSGNIGMRGLSSIAPYFWKTAEKIKGEALRETAEQAWKTHWTIPSAICLYHAALECFINEEIALVVGDRDTDATMIEAGHAIQDMTLHPGKLEKFFSFFGLEGKQTPDVWSRTVRFIALRDRLYHYSPEMRDIREYPDAVVAALEDARIERVNTSWASACRDIRLAEWAAVAVCAFIDDWCNAAGIPSRMEFPEWKA